MFRAIPTLFFFVLGAASIAQAQPGTVVVDTPLGIADRIRAPAQDESPNAARLLNLSEIFNADNYPEVARERVVEGRVNVRVKVNEQGLATHCETVGPAPPELGGPTCALFLAKARFSPARDRRGRAVKSTYVRGVYWMLEALEPEPFADAGTRVGFTFHKDGSIASCSKEMTGAWKGREAEWKDADPCELMALGARMTAGMMVPEELDQWEARHERVLRTGTVDFWESIGNGPDDRLISRVGHKLVINADGSIRTCVPIHDKELEELLPADCEKMKQGKFAAAQADDRYFSVVEIVYLHKRTGKQPTS